MSGNNSIDMDVYNPELSDIENNVEYAVARFSTMRSEDEKNSTLLSILFDLLPILGYSIEEAKKKIEDKTGMPFDSQIDDPDIEKQRKLIMEKERNYRIYEEVAFPSRIEDLKIVQQTVSGGASGYVVRDLISNVDIPARIDSLPAAHKMKENIRKIRKNNELGLIIIKAKIDAMQFGYFKPRAKMHETAYMGHLSGIENIQYREVKKEDEEENG